MAPPKKPKKTKLRPGGGNAKGAARMKVLLDTTPVRMQIRDVPKYLDRAISATTSYYEPKIENHAKLNAPWRDRTTNARNGLKADSGKDGQTHWIVLAHQVPYGIFLEVRWSGKFAIILPTLDKFGPQVMQTLTKILDRMP